MTGTALVISLTAITEDQAVALKVTEVLSRAGAGLALEGVQVGINLSTVDDVEEVQET